MTDKPDDVTFTISALKGVVNSGAVRKAAAEAIMARFSQTAPNADLTYDWRDWTDLFEIAGEHIIAALAPPIETVVIVEEPEQAENPIITKITEYVIQQNREEGVVRLTEELSNELAEQLNSMPVEEGISMMNQILELKCVPVETTKYRIMHEQFIDRIKRRANEIYKS